MRDKKKVLEKKRRNGWRTKERKMVKENFRKKKRKKKKVSEEKNQEIEVRMKERYKIKKEDKSQNEKTSRARWGSLGCDLVIPAGNAINCGWVVLYEIK